MRISYFCKEVIPPKIVTRKKLLEKLAQLRNFDIKDQTSGLNLKRVLRNRLRQTEGSVKYFYYYKGCKIQVGDETTPKKYFLLGKYAEDTVKQLKQLRQDRRKKEVNTREKRTLTSYVHYDKIGNVMRHDRTFSKINRSFRKVKAKKFKAPSDMNQYIGIEFEFASKHPEDMVIEMIADLGLHNQVRAMFDRSIAVEEGYKYQVELCVLTTIDKVDDILNKLKPLITPENFKVNNSCGLHVHIDARHSSRVRKIFSNLTAVQSVLFSLVDESRRDNRFCQPVLTTNFDEINGKDHEDHYAAISKFSYFKHQTIEVRIHHSTLDLTRVQKWIKLIQKIAAYDGPELKMGNFDHEMKQLKEQIILDTELIQYVDERSIS